MAQEYLFRKTSIFAVIQRQNEITQKDVQAIPPDTLLNASEHDLIQSLVEKLRLDVPIINEADIYIAHSVEAQVDVSGDYRYGFFDRSQPAYITGTETIIAVPFQGNPNFFYIQPQTYSLSLSPVEVRNGELLLRYLKADKNGEQIRQEYQHTVKSIQEHLKSLSQSVMQFNSQLEGVSKIRYAQEKNAF